MLLYHFDLSKKSLLPLFVCVSIPPPFFKVVTVVTAVKIRQYQGTDVIQNYLEIIK